MVDFVTVGMFVDGEVLFSDESGQENVLKWMGH
jgi:hypothetical protein